MPRVSKNRELDSQKRSLFLDDFYSAVTSLKDKREVRAFFEDLLTREEKLMLAKRFQIAMMLKLNWLWEEIGERAKVTLPTISKVNQKIKAGFQGLTRVTERIITLKRKKFKKLTEGEKRSMKFAGPELIKAGLGLFLVKRQRSRKQKSITK